MNIPKIITHKNMGSMLDELEKLASNSKEWCKQYGKRGFWASQIVTLEFPAGELAEDGLKTIALVGFSCPRIQGLTGKEGFNAQGLEGKVQIRKDLFSALMNMRDLLPQHRGRIIVG